MKALIVAFYQENATVGAFSVIVKTDGWFAALFVTLARRRARVLGPGACTTLCCCQARPGTMHRGAPATNVTTDSYIELCIKIAIMGDQSSSSFFTSPMDPISPQNSFGFENTYLRSPLSLSLYLRRNIHVH